MRESIFAIFLIFLLWLAGLGAAAQFAKIAIPFSIYRQVYPDLGAELGWLLSLISFMGAILGIVSAGMVAKWGPKQGLIFGLALGAAVSFWQSTLPEFHTMLVSRVLEGVSHLAIVVAAPTLIGQISPERIRGPSMALWGTFFGVSFALVAWLGLPLATTHGVTVLLLLHGGFMAIMAFILLAALYRVLINSKHSFSGRIRQIAKLHWQSYRSPTVSAPALGWLFYTLTYVSLLAIIPGIMGQEASNAIIVLLPLISIAASLFLIPVLLNFMTSIQIVMLGFAGALVVTVCILGNLPLWAGSISLFAVLGLVQGASFSAVPELNSTVEAQALGYGAMAQMGNIGNLLGTPILLVILGAGGQTAMFIVVAIFYGVAIGLHWRLAKQRNQTGNFE